MVDWGRQTKGWKLVRGHDTGPRHFSCYGWQLSVLNRQIAQIGDIVRGVREGDCGSTGVQELEWQLEIQNKDLTP